MPNIGAEMMKPAEPMAVLDPSVGLSSEETADLTRQLKEKFTQLEALAQTASPLERARLQLDVAELLIWLERKPEAWLLAREAFGAALAASAWQDAVEACNVLYQTGQEDAIPALGMGVWLAVTFPVEPDLTYAMLDHVIDETPNNSDGAALAAITARYVIDLRADEASHESLSLLANNLVARVALRHSNVQDQTGMDIWLNELDLRNPQAFLPRLSKVVNAIVGDQWWFDRDAIRDQLPD
jgi:hypothetical protein